MIRTFSVFVAIFSLVSAGGHEELFKKYATCSVMRSCLGKEVVTDWHMMVSDALTMCRGEDADDQAQMQEQGPTRNNWREIFEALQSGSGRPNLRPLLEKRQNYFSRDKRSSSTNINPYYSAAKIQGIKRKMKTNIQVYVCTLRELELIDNENDLRIEKMKEWYRKLNVDRELRNDLVDLQDDCYKFSQCVDPKKSALPEDITRIMIFLKCELKGRFACCMKNDLRKMRDQFELEALGDDLDHLDDAQKMLAIVWGEMKVGDEDFGLFE